MPLGNKACPSKLGLATPLFVLIALATAGVVAEEWPQFRGRGASGVANGQDLPDNWNVASGLNIRWKTAIPGLGHACPVVSRGRVFVVTADNGEREPSLKLGLYGNIASVKDDKPHQWILYCLSQTNGRVLWRRVLHKGVPAIKRHTKASHANTTPATDGRRIVVFLASEGLHCLDYSGRLIWKKSLGVLDSGYFRVRSAQWGFASSPIIHDGKVFLQCDVQEDSFLAAYSLRDGRELWRTRRDDVPTWSTPAIVEGPSRTELVVNGYRHAGGYDPDTGTELWKLGGGGDIPVPTPIYAHNLIYLSSAHGPARPLCAIRPGAVGDVATPSRGQPPQGPLIWYERRGGIYMQTPIVYGDYLYACRNNGALSCYDARNGQRLYQERVGPGGFTASAVAADGKLYFTNEDGTISVVAAGPTFKRVASNKMGEPCMATPAIADGALFVRTTHHVYSIGRPIIYASTSERCRPRKLRRIFGRLSTSPFFRCFGRR